MIIIFLIVVMLGGIFCGASMSKKFNGIEKVILYLVGVAMMTIGSILIVSKYEPIKNHKIEINVGYLKDSTLVAKDTCIILKY